MKGYQRDCKIANKLLSYLPPNIQSVNSCHGHSFLGILEKISPFNIGLESPNAFQVILLEDAIQFSHQNWKNVHNILESFGIKNHFYRFFDKQKNNYYSGLKINIERHALTINVGTDDISIKASYTDDLGDSISGGVYISLKDAEVGGITSKTKRIDKDGKTMYETSYEKSSIGLTTIAAAIIIYYSGGLLTPTAKPLPIPKPILKPVIT